MYIFEFWNFSSLNLQQTYVFRGSVQLAELWGSRSARSDHGTTVSARAASWYHLSGVAIIRRTLSLVGSAVLLLPRPSSVVFLLPLALKDSVSVGGYALTAVLSFIRLPSNVRRVSSWLQCALQRWVLGSTRFRILVRFSSGALGMRGCV